VHYVRGAVDTLGWLFYRHPNLFRIREEHGDKCGCPGNFLVRLSCSDFRCHHTFTSLRIEESRGFPFIPAETAAIYLLSFLSPSQSYICTLYSTYIYSSLTHYLSPLFLQLYLICVNLKLTDCMCVCVFGRKNMTLRSHL